MSKFSCCFFGNPTKKTITRTAQIWGLLIANHLYQSLWSTNQKYWATVRSNLLHSFLEVHNCVAPFTSHGKLHEFGAEKPISWVKPTHFDFFTINCTVWSQILSTLEDALSGPLTSLWPASFGLFGLLGLWSLPLVSFSLPFLGAFFL
jgi:hypothetical protein